MKKSTRKLVVHGEAIRALRTLESIDLARAAGGGVVRVVLNDGETNDNCAAVVALA
jgi:hypothetical protein